MATAKKLLVKAAATVKPAPRTRPARQAAPGSKPVKKPAAKASPRPPSSNITPVKKVTPALAHKKIQVQVVAKKLASAKVEKSKKPKLVRDSFTIPKAEYLVLEELKQRASKLARPAKKSEVLRAGIKALAAMSDLALLAALASVPTIKTGRPSLET